MKKGRVCIWLFLLLSGKMAEKLYGQTTSSQTIILADHKIDSDYKKAADSLFNIGSKYQDSQKFQQSSELLQASSTIYQRIGEYKKVGDCFNYIAINYYYIGNYLRAISSFEKSIDAYKKIDYKKGVASILNNTGGIYNGMGNYPKALDFYRQAVLIYEEIGDRKNLAITNLNIGVVYSEGKDYANAMRYFNRSYSVFKKLNDQKAVAQILNSIGNTYRKEGKYKESLENINHSLQIADKEKDKQLQIEAFSSLGDLFYTQSDYKKALIYFNLCLKYANEIGSLKYQSESQIEIGNIMYKLKESKESIIKCKYGLKLAEKLGALSVKKNGCECLYRSYKSLENSQLALLYYEKANSLKDSLKLEETSNRMLNMEFQKQQLVDSIAYVKKEYSIQLRHKEDVQRRNKQRNIIIISLGFILLIALGLWNRLNYVRKSRMVLEIEKGRSEALLLNILPEEIAEELKEKGSVNAREYDLVSILFTDFKSFTQTAEKMSPQSLVEEINVCFKGFDLITEKYQIEKIKTIGDAYMAAGGIPNPAENSLKNIVLAGLEMQEFMIKRSAENQRLCKPSFEMRLGIHAGPIVAGIVGVKKFQYDIWGDTVNTASRIESNGMIEKVNISETLYQLIKDETCFTFEYRGNINAKGKGDIAMYFVEKI